MLDDGNLVDLGNLSGLIRKGLEERVKPQTQTSPEELASTILPHESTFLSWITNLAKTYLVSDEALRVAHENSRYMMNDLAVMESVEMRRRSVALLNWNVSPESNGDEYLTSVARLMEKIIGRTPRFLQLRENLLYAIWYGKYGVQLQWGRTLIEGKPRWCVYNWLPVNGDKIVVKALQGNPYEKERIGIRIGRTLNNLPDSYDPRIQTTDFGQAYFLTREQRDQFILHRHMIEDGDYRDPYSAGNITGVGIRSRVYWTWYLMKETLAWLMEYVERSATGFEVWYYPAGNKTARDAIKDAAENRVGHSGNIVLVPQMNGDNGPMYSMERIEPSMSGADVCVRIVKEFFQHQIKRYILGQTLTTEAGSTGLGSNVASIHMETYMQIVKYDAVNLAETLTRELVEPIRKFNFPEVNEGELRFGIETDEADAKDRLETMRTAFDMGAEIYQSDVLSTAGIRNPSKSERILKNPSMNPQDMYSGGAFLDGQPVGGESEEEEQLDGEELGNEQEEGQGVAPDSGDNRPEAN